MEVHAFDTWTHVEKPRNTCVQYIDIYMYVHVSMYVFIIPSVIITCTCCTFDIA